MRKFLAGATLCLFSAGAASSAYAALALKGSDTLEDVTKDIIAGHAYPDGSSVAACPIGVAGLTYIGGGSGGGEAAMIAATPTQQIAPMSRELSLTTTPTVACDSTKGKQQLLIALDGLAIVGANTATGDSLQKTATTADDCGDAIVGGKTVACTAGVDGCDATGTYVFTDWKDVLAMVYGGQNHTTAAQTIVAGGTTDPRFNPAVTHKVRNPARVNCSSQVRQNLVNSWGTLFDNAPGATCRSGSCVKLKHAFRRDDLSGTTDTFVTLVGLVAIPAFTKTTIVGDPTPQFPAIDSAATANPFCNAGESPMNKGDSDYLDLDPIRRIADSESAANLRIGLEQISEGFQAPANPPAVRGNDTRVDPPVAVLSDTSLSNFQNLGYDVNIAGGVAVWQPTHTTELLARKSLGLVLPVSVPTNYADEQVAYWSPSATAGQAPVKCAPGVFAPSLIGANVVCPDGSGPNLCLLPVDVTGTNFNCLTDAPVPASTPVRDSRVYNLLVVNAAGKFVKDNYLNPNLTLTAARQNRVVSAFYRLHASQNTNFGATPTLAGTPGTSVCKQFTSTDQIGCLVKANPCSIGFAGREAVTADNTSMAFQIGKVGSSAVADALPASQANIEKLVTVVNGVGSYPISRTLWVNAYAGLSAVTNVAGELDLLNCMGNSGSFSAIDTVAKGRGFVAVPAGVTRSQSCKATFP